MRVCIVGSSGFIGSSLRKFMIQRGIDVLTISSKSINSSYGYDSVDELEKCVGLLRGVDALIYLCSPDQHSSESEPSDSLKIVLGPLASILNAKRYLPNLTLIYFSTAQVFNGVSPEKTIHDAHSTEPNNYYGLFHLYGEQMLDYFRNRYNQLNLVSLRLTNSYGFQCDTSCNWKVPALNDFISSAFDEGYVYSRSDGSPFRDFIEISSVNEFCMMLAEKLELPQNLILGSGITVNLSHIFAELQDIFAEKYNMKIKVKSEHELVLPKIAEKPRYSIDKMWCKISSKSDLKNSLTKAILDYEEFRHAT